MTEILLANRSLAVELSPTPCWERRNGGRCSVPRRVHDPQLVLGKLAPALVGLLHAQLHAAMSQHVRGLLDICKLRSVRQPQRITQPLFDVLDVLLRAVDDDDLQLHGYAIMRLTKRSGPTVYGVLDRLE